MKRLETWWDSGFQRHSHPLCPFYLRVHMFWNLLGNAVLYPRDVPGISTYSTSPAPHSNATSWVLFYRWGEWESYKETWVIFQRSHKKLSVRIGNRMPKSKTHAFWEPLVTHFGFSVSTGKKDADVGSVPLGPGWALGRWLRSSAESSRHKATQWPWEAKLLSYPGAVGESHEFPGRQGRPCNLLSKPGLFQEWKGH